MITTRNLTKRFGNFTALDNISSKINDGCIYGIVGSNGAGKSTLLRLLAGVYRPDRGTVVIDGKKVFENPSVKAQIAYVPDELYFINNATTRRMAQFYQSVYDDFDNERFNYLCEVMNIDADKSLNTFSKGMKRQAMIVLAVSCRPKYLMLDETFDGLDPVMRSLVKNIICQDVEDRNITAILTSHSLRELEDTCDQLALLHKGGLVLDSDITSLKTSLFKIQIAFLEDYDSEKFEGLDILHYTKNGSVVNMIIRGDRSETVEKLKELRPAILDVLPLTLEEIFTYEMATLGYSFDDILLNREAVTDEE